MKIDWAVPGYLAAGPLPYTEEDIRSLYQQGISAIMTLTEEPLTAQTRIAHQLLDELGIVTYHSPILDGDPPSARQAEHIIELIDTEIEAGRTVYLHCHAGIGRTGTLLHVYFLLHGQPLPEAMQSVSNARLGCRFTHLTDEQQKFIEEFAADL